MSTQEPNQKDTPEQLLIAIQKGTIDAAEGYKEIIEITTPYIWGMVTRYLKGAPEHEFEDLVALTWADIWGSIEKFDPNKSKFTTWASNIARYKTIDYLRKRRTRPEPERLDTSPEEPQSAAHTTLAIEDRTPLEDVMEKELEMRAMAALLELDPFDRTLYLIKTNYDLTFIELAEIVSNSEGRVYTEKSVQARYYRVRKRLWELIRG